jgi:hypothetical protein
VKTPQTTGLSEQDFEAQSNLQHTY